MRNKYEMVTVNEYINSLDNVKYTTISEVEITKEVEKYLLAQRRNQTNARIVEELLA